MKKLWMLGVLLLAQAGFGKVLPDEAETLFPAGRKGAVIIALDGGTRGYVEGTVPAAHPGSWRWVGHLVHARFAAQGG